MQENQPEVSKAWPAPLVNQSNNGSINQDGPINQKKSSFVVMLLSGLLLVSCIFAGFFAYQTQKLVKQLTAYSVQIKQTPTPEPTPEPTTDPTSDWNIYKDEKIGFEFKYPSQFSIDNKNIYPVYTEGPVHLVITDTSKKVEHSVIEEKFVDKIVFGISSLTNTDCVVEGDGCSEKKLLKIGDNNFYYYHSLSGMYPLYFYSIKDIKIIVEEQNLHETNEIFRKILSTFKFVD